MRIIPTAVQLESDDFRRNREHHRGLAASWRERTEKVQQGHSERSEARQRQRHKMLARERIDALLDQGSPFLELSQFAAWDMYDGDSRAAGIITGIGNIAGRQCMVVANDATVKGGSYYPMTVKKHVRAQEIALENHLPCVYLVDSGGAFLPLQDEVFPDKEHFGRIFYNQAHLSAQGIPQIAVVLGMCTAGGAYVPAMADENIIVDGNGTIYLGGPPLVKAATGEVVTAEDLGGAKMHTQVSGVADHFAKNEDEALKICRSIAANLGPGKAGRRVDVRESVPPLYDPDELYGLIPSDPRHPCDVHEILARLIDGSRLHEFKASYGPTLVCGFARWCGFEVGIVANNGVLFGESAQKGAHFVQLCNQRQIPLVFIQNITGFMVGSRYERAGIAKDGAKMVQAVSTATVPKITVVIGASHGAGNYAMCGRGYLPRFLFTWPNSRVSVMGAEQAAQVLVQIKRDQRQREGGELTDAEAEAIRAPVLEKYEREGDPYHGSARLWDDGIILPTDTRKVVALALAACNNGPKTAALAPVFRM